jgi:RNA recognition motif-containing protein
MGSKIYVGGLPFATTDTQMEAIFADHGTVESSRVITIICICYSSSQNSPV